MANDTTLRLRYPTGATLYTQIEGGSGVWNGSTFVTFAVASWAIYATATPESPNSSGRYVCQFPTSAPAGYYSWTTFLRNGGSPAAGDVPVGSGSGYWDGTTFGGASKLTAFGFSVPVSGPVNLGPAGLDAVVVENGVNARQALAVHGSESAGDLAGEGSDTLTFKALGNPDVTRIVATIGPNGRTITALNLPD